MRNRGCVAGLGLAGMLCVPLPAAAHNLGVEGKTFPIKEESFLKLVVQHAAKMNWKAVDHKLQRKAKWDVHHFPQQPLPAARSTYTAYASPGVILRHNISAPVDTAEGYQWRVVYPKGMHVNPLRRGLEPVTRMLFFNENSKAQTRFMLAALKAYPYFILPVALGGNIPKLAKDIGRPMFYAYPTILERFRITETPALLGTGRGPYRYDMAVTYFGPHHLKPHQAGTEIHAAWYGLTGKNQVRVGPRLPETLHGKQSIWNIRRKGNPIPNGGSADIYAKKALKKAARTGRN